MISSNIIYYCNDKVSYINNYIPRRHIPPRAGIKAGAHEHSANFSCMHGPGKQGLKSTATVLANLRITKAGYIETNTSQRWSNVKI
jgi:hypothetical protein